MFGLGHFVLGLLFRAQRHCQLFQAAVVEDHSRSLEAANSMEAGCRFMEGVSMLRFRGFAWVYVLGVHHHVIIIRPRAPTHRISAESWDGVFRGSGIKEGQLIETMRL